MSSAIATLPINDAAGDLLEEITEQLTTRRLAKITYIPSFSTIACRL